MALFSRYKRLGDDPFGQIPDSEADLPGASLPDVYGATSYQDDDRSGDYGNDAPDAPTSAAPPRPGVDMPPPQPSMRADSMDKAKSLKPVAVAPVPPPLGNDLADGAPTPPAGLDGAPKPPPSASDIAQSALQKYATLEGPKKPKSNVLQTIGQTILSASRFGPEGAEAIIHPKFAAQDREFKTQKGELANTVTLADKTQKVLGDEDIKAGNQQDREQHAITEALSHGIEIVPPGVKPPDGYVQTISPLAGNKKYVGATAWRDPNFGKFQVTPEQAALSNGAAAAGQWLPLNEMTQFIKGGVEQGKDRPAKADFVNVAPSTAKAMNIVAQPNDDGTVSVPTSALNAHNNRENRPEAKLGDNTLLELRSQGKSTGNAAIDGLSPKEAAASLQRLKPPPSVSSTSINMINPAALDQAAEMYATTGQMPSVGFGKSAAEMRSAIMNRAAVLHPTADLASAKTDYGASQGAIKNLEKQKSQVLTFENTASRNLDLADGLSKKVDRTGSPVLNRFLLHAKGQYAGDTDTQLLNNAVETAASEYAKVVSGGGASQATTDSARAHARDMLTSAMGKGTFSQAVALMKQEMGNRKQGYDQQLSELRSTRKGAPQAQSPAAAQGQGSGGYQAGHVYGGLTYLGGDPHNKASWKQ